MAKDKPAKKPDKERKVSAGIGPGVKLFFATKKRGGTFWFDLKGKFVSLAPADIKKHLLMMGYSETRWVAGAENGGGLKEPDWLLWRAQREAMVDYAGPLAGYRVGLHSEGTARYLVTEEASAVFDPLPARLPAPKWFLKFVSELLPGDQSFYFLHWLRIGLESLRSGDFRPGQALILAGPAECGKTLAQIVITLVLGGRVGNPIRYMLNKTQFNSDFTCAEHWMIEDPETSTDIRSRRDFGSMLKEATVNALYSVHEKGEPAQSMRLFRRLSVSVNHEPENLAVCPPMDASIRDKIILLLCGKAEVGSDRKEIERTIRAELPAIRWYLLNRLKPIPPELQSDRFGIKAWHHPELFEALNDMSPESRLLSLIDQVLEAKYSADGGWTLPHVCKALDLEKMLRESAFGFQVEKLLHYTNSCGTYLGRLERQLPERVQNRKTGGAVLWTIKPPAREDETEP